MKLHLSDRSCACLAAVALFALAGYALFGFRHGFAWYLPLFPGAIVAARVSGVIQKAIPNAEEVTFWSLFGCLNFLWYFVISFALIKAYRFVSARRG